MCAINGTTQDNAVLVRTMNEATKHRGPDGTGVYEGEGVVLGHNRLAIIDLSENAAQPMESASGRYAMTYNGEIYNFRELREELKEHYTFKSESDTEVLLAAYGVWGREMLPRLRGIFAFAVWDTKEKTLFLARDHMGVKPLYYSFESGVLTFSSELAGMVAAGQHTIDRTALGLFLELGYVPSPHAMVSGVKKLPPGHLLRWKAGEIEVTEYFNTFDTRDQAAPQTSIYDTIDASIKRQLVSDRPVGVFLSGGIDSSAVLHHMSAHTDNVRSFSVNFEMVVGAEGDEAKFNADASLAKRTALHYGAKHTTYGISLEDVRSSLEHIYQTLDEPNANPTGVSQFFLSRWVREDGVVVALGGDGGDELFGGYTRHRAVMAAHLFQRLPKALQHALHPFHRRFKSMSVPFGAPMHLKLFALPEEHINRVVKGALHAKDTTEHFFQELYKKAPDTIHPLDAFMRADRHTWLPGESLARSDRSSMAHGLELRVPLLDLDVVLLSDTISPFKKTTPRTGKKILREEYQKHLPEYLYNQPKRGWISPGAKWLRDPLINAFAKEVFSSSYYSGLDAVIDWDEVRAMLDDHVEKRGYYLEPLWNLLVLQIWAKQYSIMAS